MWGPGASGGFQNALAIGQNAGNNFMQGLQYGRQVKEEREFKNALAQFDPSRPETLQPIMQADPRVGLQLRGQVMEQQAAANKAGIEGLEQFRPLLESAIQGPEQWNAAIQAGVNAGLDMRRVPTQFDPEWAKGQLLILEAGKDPEKVGRIGEAMRAFGYTDPNMPGYNEALQEFTRMTFARESTDAQGRPILVFPKVGPAGAQAPSQPVQPVAEKVINGTAYVQDENGDWYVKGGGGSDATGNF